MSLVWIQPGESDAGRADAAAPGGATDGPVRRSGRWVLLYGDRRLLAPIISVAILSSLLVVGTVWEFEMERPVTETRAVQTLFNTLLGGIVLFVSVVLSIDTAALTREFAPLQSELARIEDSIEFQIELEELVNDGVTPAGLQPFLEFVTGTTRSETTSLRGADVPAESERAREDLLAFVREVDAELSTIENRVRKTDPRAATVLLSGRDYPYARHINVARRLRAVYGSELSERDRESLEALLRVLTVLASGRE